MFSGTDCKGDDGDNDANNDDIGDSDDIGDIGDISDDEMASVQWLAPDKSAPDWN